MPIKPSQLIELRSVPGKGRGVFATQDISEGDEIERVPVLVMPANDALHDDISDLLSHYVFEWEEGTVGLALGFGSMYNHSYTANARYDDVGKQTKLYTAVRDIAAGEEITINYNGEEGNTTDVGFDVKPEANSKKLDKPKTQKKKKAKKDLSKKKATSKKKKAKAKKKSKSKD